MRLLAIGDPHGQLNRVKRLPEADAYILTGDLGDASVTRNMIFSNIRRKAEGLEPITYTVAQRKRAFLHAYKTSVPVVKYLAKRAPVYLIYGNAEKDDMQTREYAKRLGTKLPSITEALKAIPNVHIINSKTVTINGLTVGGLGAFRDDKEKDVQRVQKILARFKKLDIFVCHQPPYGTLDKVKPRGLPKAYQGKHAGSKTILQYVKQTRPKLVLCGHIHEAFGSAKIGKSTVYNLGEAKCMLFRFASLING